MPAQITRSIPTSQPAPIPTRTTPPFRRSPAVTATPAVEGFTTTSAPLAPNIRQRVESVTGVSLLDVRVHIGPQADYAAASVGARAFTVGSHIYLRNSETATDARLLSHEAAHTIQQSVLVHSAYPRGPPQHGLALPLSAAPRGMIQREAATDSVPAPAPEPEEGFLEMGFWSVVARFAPERIVTTLHEIRRVGFWEFLKGKISSVLETIFDGMHAQGGFTAELADIFQNLIDRARPILAALADGDCEPLFAAVAEFRDTLSEIAGEAWTSITEFLQPIGDYLSNLWEEFGAPVVDFLGEFASDTWDFISGLGEDLWNWTEPARTFASGIWTEIQNLLGFGGSDSDDAEGGLGDWIAEQAGEIWAEIQTELEPVIGPIRSVVERVEEILPLEAIFNLRDTVTSWMDQAISMADTMEEEGDVAENQNLLREIVLPGVRSAIAGVQEKLTEASAWATRLIGNLVSQVTDFFTALSGNSLLAPVVGSIQWLSDEATELGLWANEKVTSVFDLAHETLDTLNEWIEPVLDALSRLVGTLSDLMGRLGDFVLGPFMLIPECIRNPIKDFLVENILGRIPVFAQLIALPDLWARAQSVFRQIVVQIFRDGNLARAAWIFFREVIQLFGLPPELITNLIRNAARAIGDILRDPGGFLLNLFRAIGQGFVQFFNNFGRHLLTGIANWLFSALGDTGIRVPTEFSLRSVVDLVLQVLDITQERIFQAIERRVGPERAAQIRRGLGIATEIFALIRILVTEGPAGLWREILSRLNNLWESIVNGVREYLINQIVSVVTRWIMSLLDVTGIMPVINAIVAIYNAIQSFAQYLRQMLEIVNNVFEGLGEIARGVLTRGANLVENNLVRLLPIAIGFMANQLGMHDLPQQVRRVVGQIRARVDQALDWIVDRIVRGVTAVMSAVRSGIAAVRDWWSAREPFTNADGENHQLYFRGSAENAQLIVESTPRPLVDYLSNYESTKSPTADERAVITQIRTRATEIENIKSARGTRGRGSFTQADGEQIRTKYDAILVLLRRLRGDGTAPPPTQITWPSSLPTGDGTHMIADPLSINPGGFSGGQPYGESPLWLAVSRRKRQRGGNTFYVRGHLLNHHLHGAGSIQNMIPITSTANGEMERFAESDVKGAVLNQNKVMRYEVHATGMGTHTGRTRIPEEAQMPTQITMSAYELEKNSSNQWVRKSGGLSFSPSPIDNTLPGETEGYIQPTT